MLLDGVENRPAESGTPMGCVYVWLKLGLKGGADGLKLAAADMAPEEEDDVVEALVLLLVPLDERLFDRLFFPMIL